MTTPAFPEARLDRIARLHVLAAALPGSMVLETVIDAPFDRVWTWLADLERSVPAFECDVDALRVVRRRPRPEGGERLRIRTRSSARFLWLPVVFDVDLAPGWCWMVSRPQLYLVGMAAEPDGDRTRFAQLEGFGTSGPPAVQALLRPLLGLSRWRHRRHVPRDVANITRLAEDLP
ncbi:MAG TPA: hypothetical protein VIL36_12450 [Acidimicrobiales bacterium]